MARQFDPRHQIVLTRVFQRQGAREFARRYPKVLFKHLSPYLAGSLSTSSRVRVIAHHYSVLVHRFDADFLVDLHSAPLELWRSVAHEGAAVTVAVYFPKEACYEGDLCVRLSSNGVSLFEAAFSIAPGSECSLAMPSVLMVGRMQGAVGRSEEIRQATKDCLGLTPPALLIVTIQAFADFIGALAIVGVSDEQLLGRQGRLHFSYDRFWGHFGEARTAAGFFVLPLPLAVRPLSEIDNRHRPRTRRQRALKGQLYQATLESLGARRGQTHPSSNSSPHPPFG